MNVFQQGLGITTVQAKQLSALESLNVSFEKGLSLGDDIYGRVDTIPNTILRAAGAIIQAISTSCSSMDTSNRSTAGAITEVTSALGVLQSSMQRSSDELLEQVEDFQEEFEHHEEDVDVPDKLNELKETIKDFLKNQATIAARSADEWSALYNDTIKYIGTDRAESQQFRRDFINQVDDLNADLSLLGELGSKINPKEAMRTIIAIAENQNISNTETLKMLTEPILLAQETTNLNTAELAKIGTRLYTRYGFSSTALEDLVDQMRNTTEGQNVDENVLLNALDTLEAKFGLIFEGNVDAIEKASESLITGVGWMQSQGIDTDMYIEDLQKLMSGDIRTSHSMDLVRKYGDVDKLISLLNNGSVSEALSTMLTTISEYDPTLAISTLGISEEASDQARLWAQAVEDGTGKRLEEFQDSVDESNTARERASEKYVSLEEQISASLDKVTSYLSTIQETLGIGFSDILLGVSILGNIIPLLGGAAGIIPGGGGLAGLLTTSGPAIGIAAGIAALAAVVIGISDAYKEVNKDKIASWGDLASGESTAGTEYLWTSSMGADGKVSWEMTGVDTSEFSEEELRNFQETQEKNYKDYTAYIESGSSLTAIGKLWDFLTSGIDDSGNTTAGALTESQLSYRDLLERISEYAVDETYGEMVNEYIRRGLLETPRNRTLSGFLDNIKEYLDLYEEGKIAEIERNGSPGAIADLIQAYDIGTNYVTQDQLAYIHEGEAITPARYNPAANMNELERLREENGDTEELTNIFDILKEIRSYMEKWKRDSEKLTKSNTLKTLSTAKLDFIKYNR